MKTTVPGKKILVPVILGFSLIVGCASNAQEPASSAATSSGGGSEAAQAIAGAQSAIDKANANNWIWRDTEMMLEKAKNAQTEQNDALAIKLANQAKNQANLAVEQYNHEKGKTFMIAR